jgi:hypothetical protein
VYHIDEHGPTPAGFDGKMDGVVPNNTNTGNTGNTGGGNGAAARPLMPSHDTLVEIHGLQPSYY